MRIISVCCSSCGAPAQIEEGRKIGFCSYCGSQLLIDEEKQKIELSGQVSVDGMLTLDKQIKSVETLQKISQWDKANTIIEKLTHEYPEDYRVWWLPICNELSETYDSNKGKYGEGNPYRFQETDYYRVVRHLNSVIEKVRIPLTLAPDGKKQELSQYVARWLSSYIQYFSWAEERTKTLYSYLSRYREICDETSQTYRKASARRARSKFFGVLVPITLFGVSFFSPDYSSNVLFPLLSVLSAFCVIGGVIWASSAPSVDHSWSWYRATAISQSLPVTEEQCLNLFEGTARIEKKNNEEFTIVDFKTPSADEIAKHSNYYKGIISEFSNV